MSFPILLRGCLRGLGVKVKESKADRWSRDGHEFVGYKHIARERGEGPTFWRTWFVTNQDVLAIVTYNCPEKGRDVERAEVDRVAASLRRSEERRVGKECRL